MKLGPFTSRTFGFLALVLLLFFISIFGNIHRPLLWNDEGHTAMTAEFTLQYGYPRITDDRNLVYAWAVNKDGSLSRVDPNLKASTMPVWAGFYYATIPVYIARYFDDPYVKTGILRIWFALTGIAGLFFLWKAVLMVIEKPKTRQWLSILFFMFCMIDINIGLHVKEVRYYSLAVLLQGLLIWSYVRMRIIENQVFWRGLCLAMFSLAFLFFTFHPLYFVYSAVLIGIEILYFILDWRRGSPVRKALVNCRAGVSTVVGATLLVVPTFSYFQPFAELSANVPFRKNLTHLAEDLIRYNFLLPVLVMKLGFMWMVFQHWQKGKIRNLLESGLFRLILLLNLIFAVYFVVIARMPENTFLFTRYYLFLLPLLIVILLAEGYVIYASIKMSRAARFVTSFVLLFSFLPFLPQKVERLGHRIYELTHRYQGPLDYEIPYLLGQFDDIHEKTIAVNYAEPVYMYYLGSKVTMGFLGNNLKEDTLLTPDIIIFKKHWSHMKGYFDSFFEQGVYEEVCFPVKDIPINNLPQLDFTISHRFRTALSDSEEEKACLYLKK